MREATGYLWSWYHKPKTVVLITTNGSIKSDGTAVMGRGCAKQAAERLPHLPGTLGYAIATDVKRVLEEAQLPDNVVVVMWGRP